MQQENRLHDFSSELLALRNETSLKTGHSANERWGWRGTACECKFSTSLRGRNVKRRKVKARLWGDRLQWLDTDSM